MTTIPELLAAMGHQLDSEGRIKVDGRNNLVDLTIRVKVVAIHQSPFGPTYVELDIPDSTTLSGARIRIERIMRAEQA